MNEIQFKAPNGATHYGFVSGVKYFYEIKNGHAYYKGKPWSHASTMNFYKIKESEHK